MKTTKIVMGMAAAAVMALTSCVFPGKGLGNVPITTDEKTNTTTKAEVTGTVDFTNLNYSMLYTKESIEEYLRAFGIDFEWVYDVVGDDDFVQGRKLRHPSLINQPATLEFSKQRHQSLINQPATQAVKKVRHIL